MVTRGDKCPHCYAELGTGMMCPNGPHKKEPETCAASTVGDECNRPIKIQLVDPEAELYEFCYEHGKQVQDVFHWCEYDFTVILL